MWDSFQGGCSDVWDLGFRDSGLGPNNADDVAALEKDEVLHSKIKYPQLLR